MSREIFTHRRDFWAAKRAEAERAARLDQCTHCGDLYESGKSHNCGEGYNVTLFRHR